MGAVLPGFKPQPEKATSSVDVVDWRPEDAAFWESEGKPIAYRNLWISEHARPASLGSALASVNRR